MGKVRAIPILLLLCAGCGRHPAGPVALGKAEAEEAAAKIRKQRSEDEAWLRSSPQSYLAAVARVDFGSKPALLAGRAEDNDVRLAAPDIEPHHLKISVDGDRFRVEGVDEAARFRAKGESLREAILDPSFIEVGRFRLRLAHQRFPAVIVFDPQSPRMQSYRGLAYFPVDLSYRYEVELERGRTPERTVILSTRGNRRAAERAGWVEFEVGDRPCRLEATRLLEPGVGENEISIFFRDATSGSETYAMGRYVDLQKLPGGRYLMDFNLAYNPACAFSEYYNCPVPPPANTLPVAIRAGERDAHYRH